MTDFSPTAPNSIEGHITVEICGENAFLLKVSGHWVTKARTQSAESLLSDLGKQSLKHLKIQCDELVDWDSRLPSFLLKIADYCAKQSIDFDIEQLPDGAKSLLHLALAVPERSGARRHEQAPSTLENIGRNIIALRKGSLDLISFIGEVIVAGWAMLKGKARFCMIDLFIFIQDVGPNGFPIVSLISLLVGLILAFVGALQLSMFGAQIYIADLVALGTVREMGPLMTAIIMSGRTGAAYAAQLGTMQVNSEIDALKTMGISPMEFLVMPRMLALVLMMPLLTLYADLMGIVGGALVAVNAFDVSLSQYYHEIIKAVDLDDFIVGFFKSIVFAIFIAIAGCMRGMACGRSASAVGDSATAAVVDSIVYLVVSDSLITLVCDRLGV